MIITGLLFGYRDIINLSSFIFSALSTGGFTPIKDITSTVTQSPMNFILILTMILGATNFLIVAGLFKRRFKEFFVSEFSVHIVIILVSIFITIVFFNLSIFDSIFHVISASSTAGFSYVTSFSDNVKLYFILLMFIGGSSISTAGGIKLFRFVLMFKAFKKIVVERITQQESKLILFGKEYSKDEIIQALVTILLMASVIIISSFILCLYNFKPIDSVFEVTSAIVNCGLSTGLVNPSLVVELKWFFIFIMIIGRVEVLAFLVIFSREKEPEFVRKKKLL
jgi:trk system potassium uptake protein TrkH